MTSVSEHYDRLLGPIYGWMLGDPKDALDAARREVSALDLPRQSAAAADLGAGLGFHVLALAEAGYETVALDTSADLLADLRGRAGGLPVRTVQASLLALRDHTASPLDAILCMGDTLTHLPDRAALDVLAEAVAGVLGPGGVFCATFRDYTVPLEGDARFIPVRSDPDRTLTCFLEYGEETVTVHDLLHERSPEGWALRVSSYPKLRLDPA